MDGQASELLLVADNDLVAFDELGWLEHVGAHLDGSSFDAEAPILDGLLLEELVDHLLDLVHFLNWIDASGLQSLTHLEGILHGRGHSVNQTEFRRKVKDGASILDGEERLIGLGDLHIVSMLEVVDHVDLLTFEVEGLSSRGATPDDLVDVVGASLAPVRDD